MNDPFYILGTFSDCLSRCTAANRAVCTFYSFFTSYQKLNSAPTKALIWFGYAHTISGVKNHENIRFGLSYKHFANMAVSVLQTTFDLVWVCPYHIAQTYTNGYGSSLGTPLYIKGDPYRIG